jgi:hypothetical protein
MQGHATNVLKMTWPISVVLAALFLAVMAGVRVVVHAAVDAGPIRIVLRFPNSAIEKKQR